MSPPDQTRVSRVLMVVASEEKDTQSMSRYIRVYRNLCASHEHVCIYKHTFLLLHYSASVCHYIKPKERRKISLFRLSVNALSLSLSYF